MAQYARVDPYKRARHNQGVDAKIVVMGNTGVGKTSLLHRYTAGKFDPKNTVSTTGAFFVTKKIDVGGLKVRLQLWDTAGQERFRSMAPMYYRGANAALLLYDITNLSSFQDIRGWLEELKRNCDPDLIIYIVGAKADLTHQRQVTQDLARVSLHNWFPPPPKPVPPASPPQSASAFGYIRPRFTSITSLRSLSSVTTAVAAAPQLAPAPSEPRHRHAHHGHSQSASFARSPPPPESPAAAIAAAAHAERPSVLKEPASLGAPLKRTASTVPPSGRPRTGSVPMARAHSAGAASIMSPSRFGGGWAALAGGGDESGSNSLDEGDDTAEEDEGEWGLSKGMELFEASAKDGHGIQQLFESLIGAIVAKRDVIEAENEVKRRDSILLAPATPSWAALADAEPEERPRSGGWSCCGI